MNDHVVYRGGGQRKNSKLAPFSLRIFSNKPVALRPQPSPGPAMAVANLHKALSNPGVTAHRLFAPPKLLLQHTLHVPDVRLA
jgi:hypothetical protein